MGKNITKIYLISSLVLLVLVPLSTQAISLDDFFDDLGEYFERDSSPAAQNDILLSNNSTQIINKVNVSANTGGNVAGEGEVVEGQSEVKVKIENIINGESIEPIDLEVKQEQGEAKVKVEQKITYPDEQGKASVEREIEINEEVETEDYQVEIEETDSSESAAIKPSLEEPESSEELESLKESTSLEKPKLISKLTNKLSQWWWNFLGGLKEKLASIVSFWKK